MPTPMSHRHCAHQYALERRKREREKARESARERGCNLEGALMRAAGMFHTLMGTGPPPSMLSSSTQKMEGGGKGLGAT